MDMPFVFNVTVLFSILLPLPLPAKLMPVLLLEVIMLFVKLLLELPPARSIVNPFDVNVLLFIRLDVRGSDDIPLLQSVITQFSTAMLVIKFASTPLDVGESVPSIVKPAQSNVTSFAVISIQTVSAEFVMLWFST